MEVLIIFCHEIWSRRGGWQAHVDVSQEGDGELKCFQPFSLMCLLVNLRSSFKDNCVIYLSLRLRNQDELEGLVAVPSVN